MKKKILIVIGTRPNFIKVTQFKKVALLYPDIDLRIVHTGQHFDAKMADVFFEQFGLIPDYFLNIPQASANTQMAEIMIRLEQLIKNDFFPGLILVVGDVNSTFAAALTGNKLGIKLGHIESGLRSDDNTMPEEINRILTDKITDYYFVTEQSGWNNLVKEGVSESQLHFVGNTMIDTLIAFSSEIDKSAILSKLTLPDKSYVLMTMHRPATVDIKEGLTKLLEIIEYITKKYKLVFPVHPRTMKNMEHFGLYKNFLENSNLILLEPLDYFAFQKLIKHSKFILTDSGGIQEETTFLRIPCLTLRPNTERPVTIEVGTNTLIPFELNAVVFQIEAIENGGYKNGTIPMYWDGNSTQRIIEAIVKL